MGLDCDLALAALSRSFDPAPRESLEAILARFHTTDEYHLSCHTDLKDFFFHTLVAANFHAQEDERLKVEFINTIYIMSNAKIDAAWVDTEEEEPNEVFPYVTIFEQVYNVLAAALILVIRYTNKQFKDANVPEFQPSLLSAKLVVRALEFLTKYNECADDGQWLDRILDRMVRYPFFHWVKDELAQPSQGITRLENMLAQIKRKEYVAKLVNAFSTSRFFEQMYAADPRTKAIMDRCDILKAPKASTTAQSAPAATSAQPAEKLAEGTAGPHGDEAGKQRQRSEPTRTSKRLCKQRQRSEPTRTSKRLRNERHRSKQ
ncbi:Hypothetical Protein FCC1311_106222 [Hondaea fermentalgiana]|uniref:Uncharacterized protein n=1 Tax=Hondaea fermentalgiana TaxID=2315210 RepID=A0A2R5GX91_9STRA|nr:Hypothetical Protein FCC1311_106222 [Hondaea fermentalgiana]|eukprot:GBG34398.1 Hypothetical Protein FCC1311_106222 [Hondaea fermentalgiana]